MVTKETFYKDKESCEGPFYHIMDNIVNPPLQKIDELYCAADSLSIKNAKIHKNIIFTLSVLGPLMTIMFFIYFEGEIREFILFCILILVLLYFIQKQSNNMKCHKKYLEYRVLAESLRLQFFLSYAGTKRKVIDILPWFIKQGVTLVEDILQTLELDTRLEKKSILQPWIIYQRTYHEDALKKAEKAKNRQKMWSNIFIFVTVATYIIALIFELYIHFYLPDFEAHSIRLLIKMAVEGMTVGTLFLESYYGKMSLSEKIEDHRRMIELYKEIEKDIKENGETEEILLETAKEFLIENSTWYSYQSKNKAELVL